MTADTDSRFANSALQLCSLAAQYLGWKPDDFWRATPCELVQAASPTEAGNATRPPSRDLIAQMMERERHG